MFFDGWCEGLAALSIQGDATANESSYKVICISTLRPIWSKEGGVFPLFLKKRMVMPTISLDNIIEQNKRTKGESQVQ
jgi:hypothetical protein